MQFVLTLLLLVVVALVTSSPIRLQAEDSHIISAGPKFNHVARLSKGNKAIFTINTEKDGEHPVCLRYGSNTAGHLLVKANGHVQSPIRFVSNSNYLCSNATLRTGINSLVLESQEGPIDLDYIDVHGASPVNERGATLPYLEYEAEDATHNGKVIGPDRTYMSLPSEASGRRAVQIQGSGQFVEFTLKKATNAIVVRFSIPDTPDGSGNVVQLNVLSSSGDILAKLELTSKHSWAYGGFPFSKHPNEGSPHHFYDESRGLLNKRVEANEKIRLVPSGSDLVYTIDLIDTYDVPSPYKKPDQFFTVTDFGADPTGQRDSTNAFFGAINKATETGKGVWIPEGNFAVSQRFQVNKIVIRGAGPWYSTVFATQAYGIGFFGNWAPNPSQNVELYDFSIIGQTQIRIDSQIDSGVGGAYSNSLVQNLWIEHTKCGMWLDGPFDGFHIVGLTIRNVYADGINFHKGVTNSVVKQSIFRNLGDDALAMWAEQEPNRNNEFSYNTIQVPLLANGVAIYGGESNKATNIYVADTICEGGGLQASNRFGARLLSGETILADSTIVRCGAPNRWNTGHNGAVWFWSLDGPIDQKVTVRNLDILDSSFAGGTFWGSQSSSIHFSDVSIDKAPYAFEVESVTGQAYFTNVVAKNIEKTGIHSCQPNFKFVMESGCSGWNSTSC
ncbi:hypothetical protein AKO1_007158 [Acrasis kona]|uniref:Uncharacterized protein n=1 Tax=Acrasis kona TaxID=1008807 RepID=A0AAW2YU81_9EUKA